MNRHTFIENSNVISFVEWMGAQLLSLPISLDIQSSKFVPGGISLDVQGIEAVTANYKWRASGMQLGDWEETSAHCESMSKAIQEAVATNDTSRSLDAAWAIIEWGGGNRKKGAYPILSGLGDALVSYLRQTRDAFRLDTGNTAGVAPPVIAMNAMLTKVHAFLATDGLPIYDSRVAVAMATLVEAWRRATIASDQLASVSIPPELMFPSLAARNKQRERVTLRYADAVLPMHLYSYNERNAAIWSATKLRLGWLMEALLLAQPSIFKSAGRMPERMRALEAALFMIGYDVRCLKGF